MRLLKRFKLKKKQITILVLIVCFVFFAFHIVNYNRGEHPKAKKKQKYVLYECNDSSCSGWADRVKGIKTVNLKILFIYEYILNTGILFAYAISLLSDRHLLINMTVPCNIENFLLPNKVNWLKHVDGFDNLTRHQIPIENLWRGKMNESKLSQINFLSYHSQTEVLIVKRGLNLINHLTINPAHHFKIKSQLGYSLDEFKIEYLIHKWFNLLFKFSDQLKIKFEKKLKLLKPHQSTRLICAQIRIGGEYGLSFMLHNQTNIFWNFIKHNLTALSKHLPTTIFVTSDTLQVLKEVRTLLKFSNERTKIVTFEENSFHINFSKKYKKKCQDIGDLIVEWLLLGHCSMGLVSHSGFGLVGILNRKNDKYEYENQFYVYTNPIQVKKNFWNRKANLDFYPFDYSFLYLEFN